MLLTTASIIEIQTALSSERFGRYLNDCTNDINRACNLYTWNMAISGAFLPWLNITEVVLRNRIHTVLTSIHGPEWPWESGFEKTLPDPRQGFNPLAELKASRKKYDNSRQTGKVIADLKFAFWQRMLTKKQLPLMEQTSLYSISICRPIKKHRCQPQNAFRLHRTNPRNKKPHRSSRTYTQPQPKRRLR